MRRIRRASGNQGVGDRDEIVDQNGRIGSIVEDRGNCVFAKPDGYDYAISDASGATGVANAKIITATAWSRNADGTYTGTWFDSKLHTRLSAKDAARESAKC